MLYGWRHSTLEERMIPFNCPKCGRDSQMLVSVQQRYAHVVFIPIIPAGKKVVLKCLSCGSRSKMRDLDVNDRYFLDEFRKEQRTPGWTFAGTALFIVLLPVAIYQSARSRQRTEAFLMAPQAGDIYQMHIDGEYSFQRVDSVVTDKVYFSGCPFTTSKVRKVHSVRDKCIQEFNVPLPVVTREELEDMYHSDQIRRIER